VSVRRLLAVAVCAGVVAPSAAAGTSWRTVSDGADGFSIAVPASWQLVPRSTKGVKARVAQLQRQKRMPLATQYAVLAAGRKGASSPFRFQAFAWPAPPGPIVPDVSVKLDTVAKGATLKSVAAGFRRALAKPRGARVAAPRRVVLPAGRAVELEGSIALTRKNAKPLHSAYTVYLLLRGKRLYSISFRYAAAQTTAEAPLFRQIADTFRLAPAPAQSP
jgi:hypothetical protein